MTREEANKLTKGTGIYFINTDNKDYTYGHFLKVENDRVYVEVGITCNLLFKVDFVDAYDSYEGVIKAIIWRTENTITFWKEELAKIVTKRKAKARRRVA
jgi:uncharacterized membrane protein